MSKFNKGDLIYIPSGATIFKWSDDNNVPAGPTKTLGEPARGLFVSNVSDFYSRVFVDGSAWTLKESDIYELKGEEDGGKAN
tara:strand:- start:1182 stop:1427 length:246 start_codon:yes stop_codon:yes gene_type:complete